jgi:uncharacterized protein YbjT (DUF2867 family)
MTSHESRPIAVCGATGRQGGAVVRHLLAGGRAVRALTRSPEKPRAQALAELGAEVVRIDMAVPSTLDAAFAGAVGVFSVQNAMISGLAGEIEQGKNVATAAKAAGVRHVVYGSAGVGRPTGVGSWDSKLAVEEHMRALELPATILRPMAFMELMSDKGFYPPVSAWHLMPKLAGAETKIPWLAVDDVGVIAAKAFADPDRYAGRTLVLAGDVRSLGECRALWKEARGRPPRRFPMPVRVFERVASKDLTTMWRWLRTGPVPLDTAPTRDIHPDALTVPEWLRQDTEERRDDGR